ncbi:MAG TPA: bifunctional metallophosphatase/5'-nucleotidase, partial [Gammaproteobacteria bacterium]|nr:bifunctional metallophosphatase/5'-nucleotidase [Gammaproteobacteria bacterium]
MNSRTFTRTVFAAAITLAAGTAHAASLTIFHNNDGESRLINGTGFGGVAFFKTTLEGMRAANAGRDQLTLSSGDNILPGLAFNASLYSGPLGSRTYFDAIALREIGYDAITLGNHDFDFGPAVLADFISFYNNYTRPGLTTAPAPFLGANLNFTGEASLQALRDTGRIASSTIITRGAHQYGVIGLMTETLPQVSNPGAVQVTSVLAAAQAEITALQNAGVNKIILSTHLQAIGNEINLISQLRGVDVVISGGGSELLLNSANARNTLAQRQGPYPMTAQDADGRNVAVVTTAGDYLYVGELDVEFDPNGEVVNISGNPVLVDQSTPTSPAGVTADPVLQSSVIVPVQAAIAAANAQQIGTTEVFLEHSQGNTNGPRVIRQRETNLGNLVADAQLWAVQRAGGSALTAGNTLIGLQNSGGIREDLDNNQDGIITQGEAVAVLPFANTTAVIGNVDVATLVAALENGVSRINPVTGVGGDGRFPQISGFSFSYDRTAAAGSP